MPKPGGSLEVPWAAEARSRSPASSHLHNFGEQHLTVCADPELCVLVSKGGFWPVGKTSTTLLNGHVGILF